MKRPKITVHVKHAILLSHDAREHRHAMNGSKYLSALRAVDDLLRSKIKYGNLPERTRAELQEVRTLLRQECLGLDDD